MQAQAIGEARPLLAPGPGTDVAALSASLQPLCGASDLERLTAPFRRSPFQNPHWLRTWLQTIPGPNIRGCYWLELSEAGGEPVLALPLVLRQERGLSILSLPDLGVSDYNPPLLGRAEIVAAHAPKALWQAIGAALPAADLLRLKRMPVAIGGVENPLRKHPLAVCSGISGWVVDLPDNWATYFASLSSNMRDKLNKCRRRFLRQPGARFVITRDIDEALAWLDAFDAMQRLRIVDKGAPYILDREPYASFYRALTRSGLHDGRIAMAAAMAGEEIVALNFAIRDGETATYLRVTNQFGPWAAMAPGLLVTEHLMRELHADGVRIFDFAMGDYAYKQRFGARRLPLVSVEIPLAWRAMPGAASRFLHRRLASAPQLQGLKENWKRWRGHPPKPACD